MIIFSIYILLQTCLYGVSIAKKLQKVDPNDFQRSNCAAMFGRQEWVVLVAGANVLLTRDFFRLALASVVRTTLVRLVFPFIYAWIFRLTRIR